MKVKSLTIDYSGLAVYRTCPRKFFYTLVKRRQPLSPSDALVFGQCIHKGLAEYHKGGNVPESPICEHNFKEFMDLSQDLYRVGHDCALCRALAAFVEAAKDTHLKDLAPDTNRSIHHGLNLIWHYVRIYGPPLSSFTPLPGKDMKPSVELTLTAPLRESGPPIIYKGTIDEVAQETATGKIVDVEHKTTLYLNEAFLNRARLNDQVSGYLFLTQENIHPDVNTVIWNCLQTASKKLSREPGECFARTSTRRTNLQLWEWRENTLKTCRRIISDIESGYFETNMPDGCTTWNSMCAFADVCNAPKELRDSMLQDNYADTDWEGTLIEVEE